MTTRGLCPGLGGEMMKRLFVFAILAGLFVGCAGEDEDLPARLAVLLRSPTRIDANDFIRLGFSPNVVGFEIEVYQSREPGTVVTRLGEGDNYWNPRFCGIETSFAPCVGGWVEGYVTIDVVVWDDEGNTLDCRYSVYVGSR